MIITMVVADETMQELMSMSGPSLRNLREVSVKNGADFNSNGPTHIS